MVDNQILGPWHIKNVPLETRKRIKIYALKYSLSLAEALTKMSKEVK